MSLPTVDPKPVAGVHRVSGPAISGVSNDAVAGPVEDIGLHVLVRRFDQRDHFAFRDGAHLAEGVYAGSKCDLALVHIAKAGEDALVQERQGDLLGGM